MTTMAGKLLSPCFQGDHFESIFHTFPNPPLKRKKKKGEGEEGEGENQPPHHFPLFLGEWTHF